MTHRHRKKIALVTGSATGIGANIAVDLAATGEYFVIVTGRDAITMQRVVANCNRIAPRPAEVSVLNHEPSPDAACAFEADLSDYQQLDRLIEFVKNKFQQLDVLVNNACWRGLFASPLQSGDDSFRDFKKVMHLNVLVPMYIIQKCLVPLTKRRREQQSSSSYTSDGWPSVDPVTVINMSSIASQIVVPLHSYSISKACLSELSRQLAESAARLGILSVTVAPGPVLTDERPHHQEMSNLTLMNRVGTTQEISNLVLFALKNAPLFNGKEINIDGGYTARQVLSSNNSNQ